VPRLATIMDEAEHDVQAYKSFPKEHRAKLHSTNPIERLNGEIKRSTDVVGSSPPTKPSSPSSARCSSNTMTSGPPDAPST
jgi:transposase-like protein